MGKKLSLPADRTQIRLMSRRRASSSAVRESVARWWSRRVAMEKPPPRRRRLRVQPVQRWPRRWRPYRASHSDLLFDMDYGGVPGTMATYWRELVSRFNGSDMGVQVGDAREVGIGDLFTSIQAAHTAGEAPTSRPTSPTRPRSTSLSRVCCSRSIPLSVARRR